MDESVFSKLIVRLIVSEYSLGESISDKSSSSRKEVEDSCTFKREDPRRRDPCVIVLLALLCRLLSFPKSNSHVDVENIPLGSYNII